MSKAVSKAPDSGQVTSAAPTQPALPADGRGRPRPRENPKTVCATGGGAGSGGGSSGPKTVLARGRLGNPQPPRRSLRGTAARGEKRDLTALELRSYVQRLGTAAGGRGRGVGWGYLEGNGNWERQREIDVG